MARRTVVWRRLDQPGLEYATLEAADAGWRLTGLAIAVLDGRPVHASYVVACDGAWRTRAVDVSVTVSVGTGGGAGALRLRADGEGRWWRDGAPCPELDGALDVDLGISPATNTLPVRRLTLAVGETRDVVAAWVRFPDLVVEPLPQRYTRLDERRFRYESDEGRFVAELALDELGLVERYANGWERVPANG